MPKIVTTEVIDHSPEVLAAMKSQVLLGLASVGQEAEGYAKSNCPVDTGRLRNSITNQVVESEMATYIGTNVEYAPYVEFGTGKYAENGQGRKTPWVYKDEKGNWHRTSGMKPSHFLRNAVSDHVAHYKAILEAALRA